MGMVTGDLYRLKMMTMTLVTRCERHRQKIRLYRLSLDKEMYRHMTHSLYRERSSSIPTDVDDETLQSLL
jgi:nitrogenase subunit NifH